MTIPNTTEITDKACESLVDLFETRGFPHADWQFLASSEEDGWLFGITTAMNMPQANGMADIYTAFLSTSLKETDQTTITHQEREEHFGTIPTVRITGEHEGVAVTLLIFIPSLASLELAKLIP
jgi:hypothetical protein